MRYLRSWYRQQTEKYDVIIYRSQVPHVRRCSGQVLYSTLLEPQYRFGDTPVKYQVVCPQTGLRSLKGLIV